MALRESDQREDSAFYKMNIFDIVLIVLILCFSVGMFLFTRLGLNWQLSEAPDASVYHEGAFLMSLDLEQDQDLSLLNGKMRLEIREGRIRVGESDCPRKICVHAGWIGHPGEIITCVPNKTLIQIRAPDDSGPDAVAY